MTSSTSDRGRILIVDDDRKILDLLLDLLELEGYEVATAVDGAQAIELALSFHPDIVVSDVVMPNVGGLELCRRLKEDPRTAYVPVLLISGLATSDEAGIEGLYAGADDYLELPFRNEELLVKVARLVERHRIGKELKESEERYRHLVELSPDAIVVHHAGKFTYVNPAAVKLWGASSPQDLIGKSILDVVHPDYHEHVRERVDYILEFQRSTELAEQKCLRLDGSELDVEVTGLPFTSEGRSAVLAVFRDVTEKKQAREALRKAEKRLRTVVASASLMLFAVDKNGVFTLCEGEGLKSLSLRAGELVGKSAFEVYSDSPQVGQNLRRALKGESFTSSVEVRDLVFEVRYSPLTDEHDNVLGVIGVATDITEARRAENSIRESEERYRELFENANDIIYTHDLQGNFTSLNRSGELITGYTREEAAKMNIADVIAPDFLALAREMMAQKASQGVSTVYEIDIIAKQGKRVRLEVSTRLIFSDGKPVGVQGIGRDLTERKHSEEALRESQAFLAQQAQREAMTHRISQAIRCSLDSQEIYQTAVRELGSYLEVDRCSLYMRDARAECGMNVAEYHVADVEPAAADFALSNIKTMLSVLSKSGVLSFSDAANDPRIADLYQSILSKAHVKSIMFVAIIV
jgi:PAS domain S-box-containing protein